MVSPARPSVSCNDLNLTSQLGKTGGVWITSGMATGLRKIGVCSNPHRVIGAWVDGDSEGGHGPDDLVRIRFREAREGPVDPLAG